MLQSAIQHKPAECNIRCIFDSGAVVALAAALQVLPLSCRPFNLMLCFIPFMVTLLSLQLPICLIAVRELLSTHRPSIPAAV